VGVGVSPSHPYAHPQDAYPFSSFLTKTKHFALIEKETVIKG
jgi:hypothetical protein